MFFPYEVVKMKRLVDERIYIFVINVFKVVVWLHQYNMQNASFKVITEPANGAPSWVLSEVQGNNYEMWVSSSVRE